MKNARCLLFCGAVLFVAGCATSMVEDLPGTLASQTVGAEPYIIGPMDVLDISVADNPDLAKQVVVRPDGKIAFQFAGELQAAGLTPRELDDELTTRLSEYIKNCEVTVSVEAFQSKRVYVFGEVGRPGAVAYNGNNTVLSALADAGYLTRDASTGDVRLIRLGDLMDEKPPVYKLDMRQVALASAFPSNLRLRPNDVLYVPRDGFAKATDTIDRVMGPFRAILKQPVAAGTMINIGKEVGLNEVSQQLGQVFK